jgi:hypothetical protein
MVLSSPFSDTESANDFPKAACYEVKSEMAASDFLTTSSALGVGDLVGVGDLFFFCVDLL